MFEEYGEHPDRLPELAAALARAPVDLIVAAGSQDVVRAARAEADRTPIVMIAINYDPIERGYADSLAHPGGNLTGVYFQSVELAAKQIELLRLMAPQASGVALLWGAETQDEFASALASAKAQGWATRSIELGAPPHDFDAIFRRISAAAPIVLVLSTPAFASHQRKVAAAALRYQLPAMFRSAPTSKLAG